jgi:subtilisin-like proprotein convertase family protein
MASLLMTLSAAGQYSVTQPAAITINDNSAGSPYPSVIDLTKSNIVGSIEKVTVTLGNLKHGYANDVGVLLVAPSGQSVVLMNNAGFGLALNGVTLTFDAAAPALPQFSGITSGTFTPGDYSGTSLMAPAPAAPYGKLADLANSVPNGKWSLYVQDDSPLNTGSIDSWTLNLYTSPLLALATNSVSVAENGNAVVVNFAVQDSSPPPGGYTLKVGNDATNLVTSVATVSGNAGTLTLTPKLNQFGTNTLTLTVSDGLSSAQADLTVGVSHVNQAPTITITNASITTVAGVMTPAINAIVADVDNDPSSLSISVSSSDTNVVAPSSVFFSPTDTGALRSFTIVPKGAATGTATLTFTVKDSGALTSTSTLAVNVQPASHPVLANATVLGLSDAGTTNSSIAVSNISGLLGKVTVAVTGLKNIAPANLGLTLVGPGGQVPLLTASANSGPNTFGQVVFADGGAASLPANDANTSLTLAPVSPLSALNGSNPNGTWSLWATNGGAGALFTGGWVLNLYVAPTITTSITNVTIAEAASTTINFNIADIDGAITNASDVTVTSGNPALIKATRTFDSATGAGTVQFTALFDPAGPQYGSTTVLLTTKDNNNFTVSFTYNVTVTFVNHAPTISFIEKQVTRAGTVLGPINFTIHDVDLPAQTLTVTASSDNQKLLPDSNILLGGSGDQRTFTLFPIGTASGTANVTLSVSDGTTTAAASFVFYVQSQGNPLFANANQISVPANAAAAPYPSTIIVNNLVGAVSEVQVSLFGITHSLPDNLNLLLTSPGGKKVLLMSHAGGSVALANTTLVFADSATDPLPDTTQLVSGVYQPTAYGPAAAFPAPAPAAPYDTALAAFNGLSGTNANGTWSLYIVDDGLGKGVIVNGWQLSIRTTPSVQALADVTLKENDKTLQIPVSVGDDQPGVNISVTATAADPTVINASFEPGSGGTRILDITPIPYQIGSNILVTVTAQSGASSSSTTFHVTVYPVNLPPVASSIADVTTPAASASPKTVVTVWDPQDKPLTVTASSSDTRLIPDANIVVTSGTVIGQTNKHDIYQYGISALPAGAFYGQATITVVVTDSVGQSTTKSFKLTVTQAPVFTSLDGPISIPEGYPILEKATPYPSVINVSNLDGFVTGVKVTLLGFTHNYPQDVDVLLVSPDNSKAVVLMAHAGGAQPISNLRLTFDDSGSVLDFGAPLAVGTYAPVDYAASLVFPPGAPASGYTTNLASFVGVSPNGAWKLYVIDDSFPIGGSIGNWMLSLQTGPAFTPIAAQTTLENTTKVIALTLLDQTVDPTNLTVYASSGNNAPTNLNWNLVQSLQVTNNGGANRTLIVTPTPNLPSTVTNVDGTVTIFLQVTDGAVTNTTSFPLTVVYSNLPPIVTTTANSVDLNQNSPATLSFSISDLDSTLYASNCIVTFGDANLVPNTTNGIFVTFDTNRVVQGATATATVKVTPALNAYGTNRLSFAITDGSTFVTNSVTLNVKHVYQGPTITGLTDQSVVAGTSTAPIPFTVASVEGVSAKSLTVTAVSANQALVPARNIVLSGSTDIRTIQLTPIGTISGSSQITLSVGDGVLTNTYSFVLNVLPPPRTLFGNGQLVSIVGNATNIAGQPYPLAFDVTNLIGGIYNVSLEFRGFSNSAPANLDALLVSPDGISVMLMSGAGGLGTVSGLDLVFDDSGATMPDTAALASASYHPAYYTKRLLPAPAPQADYQSRLSAFTACTQVNGTWRLYLNDKTLGDFGQIAGGCYLTIVTKPTIQVTSTLPVNIPENGSGTVQFTVDDAITAVTNLTVSAASDNAGLLPAALPNLNLQPVAPGTNGDFVATLRPVQYQNGTVNLTLTASRNDGATISAIVPVIVGATNFPPAISRLLPQETPENTPVTVEFLVSDQDSPLSKLTVKAVSSAQDVIGDTNLVFVGGTNNVLNGLPPSGVAQISDLKLTMQPNSYSVGIATIWVIVTDSTTNGVNVVSNSFVLTVNPVIYSPTVSAVPTQTVPAGSNLDISISVNSLNQVAPNLAVTCVSSDQSVVKDANITITPASGVSIPNRLVHLTAEPNVKGSATITLTVTDTVNNKSAVTSFTLNVLQAPVHNIANTHQIVITDHAAATPYPSTIDVSGFRGLVTKLAVAVNGFTHGYPADVGLLLVGPGGQKIVLMDKAGGGTSVTNLNLVFDQGAATTVPQGVALTSSAYKPANYNSATFDFPAPAPAHAYGTDLTALNGLSPNGTWSLYVVDDTPPDAGTINNGWALSITTLPQINGLTNIVINENTTGVESFTIGDDSPSGPAYRFGVSSTNSALIPDSAITVTGTGPSYLLTLKPAKNAFGTNLVTIYATNIDNMVASSTMLVTIPYIVQAPVIDPIANQSSPAGSYATVNVNYGDIQVSKDKLLVSFQSSNPALIPVGNIQLVNGQLRIRPVGALTGSSQITMSVAQPASEGGLSASATFTLNITPVSYLFGNAGTITINDRSAATPYPCTIHVAGAYGNIIKTTVSLVGLRHTYPSDISMMLVGPQGQKVVLMSRVGAGVGSAIDNTDLTFEDGSANSLPQNGLIASGAYKPTSYNGSLNFNGSVPSGPIVTNLSAFNGTSPNGDWSLYVQDDLSPDSGSIVGGWLVQFVTTAPLVSAIAPQTTLENKPLTVPFTVSSALTSATNLTVTATSGSEGPAGLVSNLSISGPGTNAATSRTLAITPAANMPSAVTNGDGSAIITLTVTDGTNSSSTSFPLTVQYVNQAPTLVGLAPQTTPANVPLSVQFTAADVDTAASNLTVVADSSLDSLGDLELTSAGNNQTLKFTPNGAVGQTVITVVVSDGLLQATNSFELTVTPALPPVIASIADQVTTANVPASVPLSVTSPAAAVSNLTFTANADPAMVSKVSFAINGSAVVATVTPALNQVGTTVITVIASDGITNASRSFNLAINRPAPPVLGAISDQATKRNRPLSVGLNVSDPAMPLSSLSLNATTADPTLVSGVSFSNDGTKIAATLNLVQNAMGSTLVTIFVSDGFTTVSNSFTLTVTNTIPPTLAAIADQTTTANKPVTVVLNVTSPDTALTNLTFTGSSTNSALVSGVTFAYNGTNEVATINLVSNKVGEATITISVGDGFATDTKTFDLYVKSLVGPTMAIRVENNQLKITCTGAPGASYSLHSSSDLKNWTKIATVTTDQNGAAEQAVALPGSPAIQFYRALAE